MKTIYIILTIVFWIGVVVATIILGRRLTLGNFSGSEYKGLVYVIAYTLGIIIANAFLPSIFYLVRYFAGKKLSNNDR